MRWSLALVGGKKVRKKGWDIDQFAPLDHDAKYTWEVIQVRSCADCDRRIVLSAYDANHLPGGHAVRTAPVSYRLQRQPRNA